MKFKGLSTAAMIINLEKAVELMEKENLSLDLSPDILSGYFEQGASSLFNLIRFAEKNAGG